MKAIITITDAPGENGENYMDITLDFDPPVPEGAEPTESPAQSLAASLMLFIAAHKNG